MRTQRTILYKKLLVLTVAFLALKSASGSSGSAVSSLLEIRQQNVVMQKWDLSCGAAALATLMNFQHGMQLSEKEVAVELIDRPEYIDTPELLQIKEGFSLLDLKLFVENRGYRGEGYGGLSIEDLKDMGTSIIPVALDGYNHFVVFRAVSGNRVLVADPAWGNRTLMLDKFIDAWIDIDGVGRVGFFVYADEVAADTPARNRLQASELDFVMLR